MEVQVGTKSQILSALLQSTYVESCSRLVYIASTVPHIILESHCTSVNCPCLHVLCSVALLLSAMYFVIWLSFFDVPV